MKSLYLSQRFLQKSLSRILSVNNALLVVVVLSGCVTYLPVDEWNTARAAYEGARENDAARFVPALWFKAEQAYREAQRAYKDRDYELAKTLFNRSRLYSEQAENAARLARYQSGEVIP